MVFYFTPLDTRYVIYMGRDKHENEDLIKYAFPEDLWFHVDKMSSAHVYLRLPKEETMEDIPKQVLEECCQLVKANSIEGCKLSNVNVVYTPATNLRKTADMEIGQVGFHSRKAVKSYLVEKKSNEIMNRINKTKEEKNDVDFKALKDRRDAQEREAKKAAMAEQKRKEKEEAAEREKLKQERSYDRIFNEEKMVSNSQLAEQGVEDFEDDFM